MDLNTINDSIEAKANEFSIRMEEAKVAKAQESKKKQLLRKVSTIVNED